eukprot:9488694-Pyramimonas_sp.AAC.1
MTLAVAEPEHQALACRRSRAAALDREGGCGEDGEPDGGPRVVGRCSASVIVPCRPSRALPRTSVTIIVRFFAAVLSFAPEGEARRFSFPSQERRT